MPQRVWERKGGRRERRGREAKDIDEENKKKGSIEKRGRKKEEEEKRKGMVRKCIEMAREGWEEEGRMRERMEGNINEEDRGEGRTNIDEGR